MKLTLRLADAPSGQFRTLEHGTLSIGRGADNGWVLADPDRTLSKNHCRIDASEHGFMLTDISTNGVFLDGAQQPVGRGHSVALEDGDSFTVGPYRMVAEVSDGDEYRDSLADGQESVSAGISPLVPAIEEPWLAGLPGGDFGPGRRAAPQGWDAPPDPASFSASGLLEAPSGDSPIGDNLFEGAGLFSQHSEHVAAASTVMRLPEAQVVLPSDWMVGDPAEPPHALAPAAAPVEAESWPPVLPEPAALPDVIVSRNGEPGLHLEVKSRPPLDWADIVPPPAAAPPLPVAPVAVVSPPVTPPAPLPVDVVSPEPDSVAATELVPPSALVAAFLEGAGLPSTTLAGVDPEAAFREIGQMVRAAVEGVRDIMSTRALVKSEFRVDQTVLRRSDNNQVKFAPDAERCLAAMVGAAPPGFLTGPAAMQDSMDDIKLHELALVAALNSVFADLGQQLDPEAITRRARQETSVANMLPYAREAKCWAIYMENYRLFQETGAANTGGSLLAPLAHAYARHLKRTR